MKEADNLFVFGIGINFLVQRIGFGGGNGLLTVTHTSNEYSDKEPKLTQELAIFTKIVIRIKSFKVIFNDLCKISRVVLVTILAIQVSLRIV